MFRVVLFSLMLVVPCAAAVAEPLHVYGPGGPLPAIKEAASSFGKAHGIDVEVVAGPTGTWISQANKMPT